MKRLYVYSLILQIRAENAVLSWLHRQFTYLQDHPEPYWFNAAAYQVLTGIQWLLVPSN